MFTSEVRCARYFDGREDTIEGSDCRLVFQTATEKKGNVQLLHVSPKNIYKQTSPENNRNVSNSNN